MKPQMWGQDASMTLPVLAQVAQTHGLCAGSTRNGMAMKHASLSQHISANECCWCAEVSKDDVELVDEDLDAGAWRYPDLDLDVG